MERDHTRRHPRAGTENFNSRAHVERDRLQSQKIIYIWKFQLTRSRGARPPYSGLTSIRYQKFQLTRSRGARQVLQGKYKNEAKISTHALTWSATLREYRSLCAELDISTHALTWSATFIPNAGHVFLVGISTHALTWSAT